MGHFTPLCLHSANPVQILLSGVPGWTAAIQMSFIWTVTQCFLFPKRSSNGFCPFGSTLSSWTTSCSTHRLTEQDITRSWFKPRTRQPFLLSYRQQQEVQIFYGTGCSAWLTAGLTLDDILKWFLSQGKIFPVLPQSVRHDTRLVWDCIKDVSDRVCVFFSSWPFRQCSILS